MVFEVGRDQRGGRHDTPFDFGVKSTWHHGARILVSTRAAAIAGRVTDERSAPVSDYTVVVVPRDRTKWFPGSRYLQVARPSQDDSFEVAGIAAGEYWIVAVDALDATPSAGEWQDPEVLEKLVARAERVTVREADVLRLPLRLTRR